MPIVLDFERQLVDLENEVLRLRRLRDDGDEALTPTIETLEQEVDNLKKVHLERLTSYQRTMLCRHPERPYTLDYLDLVFEDWIELHGDRVFMDDPSIVGGLARLDGRPVMVVGHQKGRTAKEMVKRNFGMTRPEGFQKAQRLMRMAERLGRPIVTFVDTPGAYPGIGAEERGQARAIAQSIMMMSTLRVPVVAVVIGEGGSGGALALAVGNRILMLENAIFSVISPEACASILWRDRSEAARAAEALRYTAASCRRLGIADDVIAEPSTGAHRDAPAAAAALGRALGRTLEELSALGPDELVADRRRKLRGIGVVQQLPPPQA